MRLQHRDCRRRHVAVDMGHQQRLRIAVAEAAGGEHLVEDRGAPAALSGCYVDPIRVASGSEARDVEIADEALAHLLTYSPRDLAASRSAGLAEQGRNVDSAHAQA